jgi:predicted RNase H-like HicB family nuclease
LQNPGEKQMPKTKSSIEVSIYVRKEHKQYCSWCPELDVASCGETAEQARLNLEDAIDLYLNTLAEEGELDRVLRERDIKPLEGNQSPDRPEISSFRTGIPSSA